MPYVKGSSVPLGGLLKVSHGTAALLLSGRLLEELALLLDLKLVQMCSASTQFHPLGETVPTIRSISSMEAPIN